MLEKMEVRFPADLAQRLEERLKLVGQTPETYIQILVALDLDRKPSLSEIMAPVADDFRRSGMTQEQLDSWSDEIIAKSRMGEESSQHGTSGE